MFKKYLNKRAVSPVIAVVLLIALTVAAAAIIWSIANGLLTPQVSLTVTTSDATASTGVWTGTIQTSAAGDITSMALSGSTSYSNSSITTLTLVKGSNSVTWDFGTSVTAGTYTLTVTFTATGSDSQTTTTASVTFA